MESISFSHKHKHINLNIRKEENQLDVTECFIALMIPSTCFGYFYAHYQELETICVLLPPIVCSYWFSGGKCRAAGCLSMKKDAARRAASFFMVCSVM